MRIIIATSPVDSHYHQLQEIDTLWNIPLMGSIDKSQDEFIVLVTGFGVGFELSHAVSYN